MSEVLVLNRNYFAVHITGWQTAISLLYKGQATALDDQYMTYDFDEWKQASEAFANNGFIQAVSFRIAIPEIIVLKYYDELPRSDVRFTRKNIYKHYNFKCCYCGSRFKTEELNLDHVTPRSKGGPTDWKNIVLTCIPCNARKGSNTPEQAGFKMHYRPTKPAWRPAYALKIDSGLKIRLSWQKFIDSVYWNSDLDGG
jgi:5-methylcytosine-specific restriction endonuclease McrA